MASALQLAVQSIQLTNYTAVVILAAVCYDYVLTFSDEITYIWRKPWTRVSTIFVLARYFGLCSCVLGALYVRVDVSFALIHCNQAWSNSCNIAVILDTWTQMIFFAAAELGMILRVWALYNRSKFILVTLLAVYGIEVIAYLVDAVFFTIHSVGAAVQIQNFRVCVQPSVSFVFSLLSNSAQITLGTLMCLLVIIHSIRESIRMYNATRDVHLNRYAYLLVREGMVYFLVVLISAVFDMMFSTGDIATSGWHEILTALTLYIPPYTLVPRLILSLRELYARDLQSRRGGEIDTAFGFSAVSGHGGAVSTIMFADTPQNEGSEEGLQDEEIQAEDRANGTGGNSDDA